MTTDALQQTDWTNTHLQLSDGPQLFANAGISRLRRAVEQQFADQQLRQTEVHTVTADSAMPESGCAAIQAFAALSPDRSLTQLLDRCAEHLRPGGRLVLDLRSPAHWQAAFADDMGQWPQHAREDAATAFCAPSDLLALASARGFSLVSLQPYAGLWDNAMLYRSLPHRFKWLRLLSWLEADEAFFQLALFLEQQVMARLAPSASGRYLVTLEKGANPAANVQWLSRLATLEGVLESPDLNGVEALLERSTEQLRAEGVPLTTSLRTRHVLYLLQRALAAHRPGFATEPYLDVETNAQLLRWRTAHAIDQRNGAILQQWAGSELHRGNVDLAAGLHYQLAANLLRDYFKTHTGVSA